MKKLSKNKRKVKYKEINKIVIINDAKLSMSLCEKGGCDVISNHELPPLHPVCCICIYCYYVAPQSMKLRSLYTQFKSRLRLVHLLKRYARYIIIKKIILKRGSNLIKLFAIFQEDFQSESFLTPISNY